MKRRRNNSKYILICIIFLSILCIGYLVISTLLSRATGSTGPSVTPVPTVYPEQTVTATPVPQITEGPKAAYYDANDIQLALLPVVKEQKSGELLFENKRYEINHETFCELFSSLIPLTEDRFITYEAVSIGDVACTGDIFGVCIGFWENTPVFAYPGSRSITQETTQIYAGTSFSQKDALYCGMYPVPFTTYYDTGMGECDASLLLEYQGVWEKEKHPSHTSVYDYGRIFSTKDAETVRLLIPEKTLKSESLKFTDGQPKRFLSEFSNYCESSLKGEYSFFITDSYSFDVYELDYIQYDVTMVSLEAETFLKTDGVWTITIREDNLCFPCPYLSLTAYADMVGLARSTISRATEDESGQIIYVQEEMQYGFSENESGEVIYRDQYGTEIVFENYDEMNDIMFYSSVSEEEWYQHLRDHGWVVDDYGNTFEGTVLEDAEGNLYYNGIWRDATGKVVAEVHEYDESDIIIIQEEIDE